MEVIKMDEISDLLESIKSKLLDKVSMGCEHRLDCDPESPDREFSVSFNYEHTMETLDELKKKTTLLRDIRTYMLSTDTYFDEFVDSCLVDISANVPAENREDTGKLYEFMQGIDQIVDKYAK